MRNNRYPHRSNRTDRLPGRLPEAPDRAKVHRFGEAEFRISGQSLYVTLTLTRTNLTNGRVGALR